MSARQSERGGADVPTWDNLTCPRCDGRLRPVALVGSVFGCAACRETWYCPEPTLAEARARHAAARS